MKLKKIELKGFKSFGQPVTLHFSERVTGVVGPNGSGKSNIVDAFRWVLGEQRTTGLRLEKMVDVLYNGSKSRKPANSCSVHLIFENDKGILPSEFTEVEISRHLYRSGNSEYRLNGVACRLKDIVGILADTGIGSNSYAIISLDMVDDILLDKDQARRRMFEEAAGIAKFKKRKKEVQGKLKLSEADLDRVQDLLFEISQNLKQLEKQARKARSYNKLRGKYKETSILHARLQMAGLMSGSRKIKTDLQTQQDQLLGIQKNIHQLEAEIQKDKQTNLQSEEKLNSSQRKLAEHTNLLRQLESDRDLSNQSLKSMEENRLKRDQRLKELEELLEKVNQRIDYLNERLVSEQEDLKIKADAFEKLKEQKNQADQRAAELADVQKQNEAKLKEWEVRKNEVEKKILVLHNQLESLTSEMNRLKEEGKVEVEKRDGIEKEWTALNEQLELITKKIERLKKQEDERKSNFIELKSQLESVETELKASERKLDSSKNERALLKSMLEKMEGYPESIKFLSKQIDWSREAMLLSDLIYCKEEFRPAIEAVLEPWLDHYVVPDRFTAGQGMTLLKESQKGKAQFLLLDAFTETGQAERTYPDTLRATDLIEVDEHVRPLFYNLLQNVFIYTGENMTTDLPAKDMIMVAKDGSFIHRPFSSSGGSGDLFSGKRIGRKKALELLDKQIEKLNAKTEEGLRSLRALKVKISQEDHDGHIVAIQQQEKEASSIKASLAALEASRSSAESLMQRRENRMAELDKSVEKINSELKDLKAEEQRLNQGLNDWAQRMGDESSGLQDALELKGKVSEAYNQAHIEWIQQQNKVQSLEKEADFQKSRKAEYELENRKLNQQNKDDVQKEKEISQRLEQLAEEIDQGRKVKKELEGGLNETEQAYFAFRNAIFEKEKELSKNNQQLRELQSVIEQLKTKNQESDWQLRAISERLEVEFNVKIDPSAELELTEEESTENVIDVRQRQEKLKNRLAGFGDVNPLALEAFEEMKVRFDDITTQKKDIEDARDSLLETIQEIETTARERFIDAFEKVRFNFIAVFRSLFTEDDNCDLMLTDPENPLESDVEIIAKPKGKRPQSVTQLSGGEKTLTATALLFALYLLKPAPFCIFDEVDAPLDDANIQKFNRIIRDFSKDSQFIIVTHNKQTMSKLDVIYGVYMEEAGVSGVSAVDFRALKNEDFLTEVRENA